MIEESALQKLGGEKKIWVAIDEAQKCPALFDQVKLIYDKYKNQNAIKFILTGSGFLTLHQLSAESLAGRIELNHLREFGLQETAILQTGKKLPMVSLLDIICDHQKPSAILQNLDALLPFRQIFQEALETQLVWGGLPELLLLTNKNERLNYLGNYLQTYLEKDIRAITTITDLNIYQKLMEITANQTSSVRDDTRIINALGCSRDTLKKYRGFLEATLIYREIYPYINSSLKRLVKSPKGYLTNNGLISYLLGIDTLSILEKTGMIGARFENWVLNELQIWLDRDPRKHQIYFWRTSTGTEVDFIVHRPPDVFPFEVTYSNQISTKKLKNLKQFMQQEKNAQTGFYIYKGEYRYDPENNIYFLPAWVLG
jgi:predicted AAA+ superfamily ATPase